MHLQWEKSIYNSEKTAFTTRSVEERFTVFTVTSREREKRKGERNIALERICIVARGGRRG